MGARCETSRYWACKSYSEEMQGSMHSNVVAGSRMQLSLGWPKCEWECDF